MNRACALGCVLIPLLSLSAGAAAGPPTDNPLATYYDGGEGYPAWTARIRWSSVIDMSKYAQGKTAFEKFEAARDELADRGGGVLYYPGGTYDFSSGPFDGPRGRGLMLRSGVVLRGQAPKGKPKATAGKLALPTKFVFGFTKRTGAIETGPRASVWLDGAMFTENRGRRQPVRVQLSFPAKDGKIDAAGAAAYARIFNKEAHPVRVKATEAGGEIRLAVEVDVVSAVTSRRGREKVTTRIEKKGAYIVTLCREGRRLPGWFAGTFDGQEVKGDATGRLFSVTPETPRDWNLIGLGPRKGKRIKDVDRVGIVWVHLVGATIYFGPDIEWGPTWRTARSWKSPYVKPAWAGRAADGTHPWDPFVGGGKTYVGAGGGRLVFGCVLQDAVCVNNSITMGRPDTPGGFGPDGYYMAKFGPRIGVYGSRVFVGNNVVAKSVGRNFKYRQTTRYTYPGGKGGSMAFGPESVRAVLFDYNKACGVDVNKTLLGLTGGKRLPDDSPPAGLFEEGVVVRDNWVYNNGHKGFNLSGRWITVTGNHNERAFLREADDPYGIGGWELTLGGYLQSSPGGNGAISDNLSRAFDLAGQHLWADGNYLNNTGSSPGNDGEAILCQAHGGTQWYSWALTRNRHERGTGWSSYIGAWDVHMYGALIAWNETTGWVGITKVGRTTSADLAFVANRAGKGTKAPAHALTSDPGGRLAPPANVKAEAYEGDAVRVTWTDKSDNEIGFRVDRKIDGGKWRRIAYRPPHIEGHKYNPQAWVDFLAPPGRKLQHRVVALNTHDTDAGASRPTPPIVLPPPK